MPLEMICTLITVCGTVVSASIAWFVSRSTANKEIERLKLFWEREDVVSSDDDFVEMASKVASYISGVRDGYSLGIQDVASIVAAVRSKESGALATLLDELYSAVTSKNLYAIDSALTRVIEEKRKRKTAQHTGND